MKTFFAIGLLFIGLMSFGQSNFKWDVVIDSLDNNKSELYSKSKTFIKEARKSANDVIQNDDKEGGVIFVKGLNFQSLRYKASDHRWRFSYSIKFLMKDYECRIIIDDVLCTSAKVGSYNWPKMPVADSYPESKGIRITGVNKVRYTTIMDSLKGELQFVVNSYVSSLKKP